MEVIFYIASRPKDILPGSFAMPYRRCANCYGTEEEHEIGCDRNEKFKIPMVIEKLIQRSDKMELALKEIRDTINEFEKEFFYGNRKTDQVDAALGGPLGRIRSISWRGLR
jgi:hypothetical protein